MDVAIWRCLSAIWLCGNVVVFQVPMLKYAEQVKETWKKSCCRLIFVHDKAEECIQTCWHIKNFKHENLLQASTDAKNLETGILLSQTFHGCFETPNNSDGK